MDPALNRLIGVAITTASPSLTEEEQEQEQDEEQSVITTKKPTTSSPKKPSFFERISNKALLAMNNVIGVSDSKCTSTCAPCTTEAPKQTESPTQTTLPPIYADLGIPHPMPVYNSPPLQLKNTDSSLVANTNYASVSPAAVPSKISESIDLNTNAMKMELRPRIKMPSNKKNKPTPLNNHVIVSEETKPELPRGIFMNTRTITKHDIKKVKDLVNNSDVQAFDSGTNYGQL